MVAFQASPNPEQPPETGRRLRILFLSAWFPYPPTNGSKLRVYNLLRCLGRHHDVTLLSFADGTDVHVEPSPLTELCRTLRPVPRPLFDGGALRVRLALLGPTPRSLVATFSPEMARRIREVLAAEPYDLVIASQLAVARYAEAFGGAPALFEEVEVGLYHPDAARGGSPWRRLRQRLTWTKHRRYLGRLLRAFRACTVASPRERALLAEAVPGYDAVEVVPNCVDLAECAGVRGAPVADTLVFTGSFRYAANHDAMTWFVREIYPRIRAARPTARLAITGDPAGRALPPGDQITLTGHVDDVRPLIASAWVSLAPIRQGGGTRVKILEAMALGTPVVATSKGAEGLEAVPGEHLLVADDAPGFAASVLRLLSEAGLRARLAEGGRRLVRERYDWGIVGARFDRLVEAVARRADR